MPTPLPATATVIRQIRRMRTQRGMSAAAMAAALTANGYTVGRASLANQEIGRVQTIPVDLVVAAAKVFNVTVGELLEDTPCSACGGEPPTGFTCNICGAGTRED